MRYYVFSLEKLIIEIQVEMQLVDNDNFGSDTYSII